MDSITHAALGAACSQAIFGKYSKHIPWQIGALAAMAPDLDIFIRSNHSLSIEYWHRNFTHSLTFIPIGGLVVALFFLCFARYRIQWKITLGAALVGYATHGFLDALTSYGTVLLWPWSNARISWDIIAIIDPIFTIPLVLGTAWSVIHREQKAVVLGLLCAAFILLFNTIQHERAIQSLQAFATQQQLHLTKIRAMPELASSTNWRLIAKNNNCLLVVDAETPVGKPSILKQVAQVPIYSKMFKPSLSLGQRRDLELFSWFSDNYVIVANQDPLTIADGRFTIGINPLYSLWGIKILPNEKHITKLKFILLNERCV